MENLEGIGDIYEEIGIFMGELKSFSLGLSIKSDFFLGLVIKLQGNSNINLTYFNIIANLPCFSSHFP